MENSCGEGSSSSSIEDKIDEKSFSHTNLFNVTQHILF